MLVGVCSQWDESEEVYLAYSAVIGRAGIVSCPHLQLTDEEAAALTHSAGIIRGTVALAREGKWDQLILQ